MDRHFFREMLEENPGLAKQILAANADRMPRLPGIFPESLAPLVHASPSLGRLVLQRSVTAAMDDTSWWDYTEESTRLALMPPEALGRIAKMAAGAVLSDDIAACVSRTDVLALRDFFGHEAYSYALGRGRYQIGSLREALAALAGGGPVLERSQRLSRKILGELAGHWPEGLQRAAAPLLESLAEPSASLSDEDSRRLWFAIKKILIRELDPQWMQFFA